MGWRYLDLRTNSHRGSVDKLAAFPPMSHVSVLYTQGQSLVPGLFGRPQIAIELELESSHLLLLSKLDGTADFLKNERQYFLIDWHDGCCANRLRTLISRMRACIHDEAVKTDQAHWVILAPAVAETTINDMLYASGVGHNAYLLWHDAKSATDMDTDAGVIANAWWGAGWPSLSRPDGDAKTWYLDDEIAQKLDRELRALCKRMDMACTGNKPTEPEPELVDEHQREAFRLFEYFLPRHKLSGNRWAFSQTQGGGRPMPWRNWLHTVSGKRMLKHLLMEGWLTLWQDVDDDSATLRLQPASLLVLYWAAMRMGHPHTQSPEAFVANYEWRKSDHWFGGMYPPLAEGATK